MQFTLKTTVLFGLLATTFALPAANDNGYEGAVQQLDARMAKVPDTINCDGTEFNKADIDVAISNSKFSTVGYPKKFGNKRGNNEKVFTNIPDGVQLWEHPLSDPAWVTGPPGRFRVVVNDAYKYIGCMYHPPGTGNTFNKCE